LTRPYQITAFVLRGAQLQFNYAFMIINACLLHARIPVTFSDFFEHAAIMQQRRGKVVSGPTEICSICAESKHSFPGEYVSFVLRYRL
jgi:hypothetical protein